MVLRTRDIDTRVLFRIATSGVIVSTLLHACDADCQLVVIADCCANLDAALQRSTAAVAVLCSRCFKLELYAITHIANHLRPCLRSCDGGYRLRLASLS
jgi:nicotinamidase-related amidase